MKSRNLHEETVEMLKSPDRAKVEWGDEWGRKLFEPRADPVRELRAAHRGRVAQRAVAS